MIVDIKKASIWATKKLKRNISPHNISYLVNYGRVKKIEKDNKIYVNLLELEKYYKTFYKLQEEYKKKYKDIEWELSFDWVKESERTKHVHRLHPYKGKFIPQLVEYFLDSHTDNLKKEIFFQKEDIVIDPFCGSGTTLVQANELGIHSIGVDVSPFNAFISNVKLIDVDFEKLEKEIDKILVRLNNFVKEMKDINGDGTLDDNVKDIINDAKDRFEKAMDNDLNISEALGSVFDFVKKVYNIKDLNKNDAKKILDFMKSVDSVIGVIDFSDSEIPSEIVNLMEERDKAKKEKDWKRSDEIRDVIKKKGYEVLDSKEGSKVRKI